MSLAVFRQLPPTARRIGESRLLCPAVPRIVPAAGKKYKYFPDRDIKPPNKFENLNMPERYRLPIMPKTPNFWSIGKRQ